LARTQKVDVAQISVLALAEQYLAFIQKVRELRIEVAADYLVMAAWLAFLKSRMLLPRQDDPDDLMSGEEMAQRLAFRLVRLDAMRRAVGELMARKRLGRDVFSRGLPERVETVRETIFTADIFDLLAAYATPRQRTARPRVHVVRRRPAWSIKDARRRLETMVGIGLASWTALDIYIVRFLVPPEEARTAVASAFGATLELAREGRVELRQDGPFAPLYVRGRRDGEA
jgi:segregation and condensation protein A